MNIDQKIADKIVELNHKNEKHRLSPWACLSKDGIRLDPEREKIPTEKNIRPSFFHDTDRIIHSHTYTRYIDKTQVFSHIKNDHITHRVLHVQLVAKIARVIGRSLNLNEDLIEAIALGHDLGHVPYGHVGERILDSICEYESLGHFTHNAQSVRAVLELEKEGQGLNLTVQTMDGILCHNGELFSQEYRPDLEKTPKKLLDQYESCFVVPNYSKKLRPMTLEGCVVRLSDIIAYIGRDVEDAITIGMIKRGDLPADVVRVLGNSNDNIVNTLVVDIINNSFGKDYISLTSEVYGALISLRKFNYEKIYLHPMNIEDEPKIKKMFHELFTYFVKDIEDKNSYISKWANEKMGEKYRCETKDKKIVLDYISGMTDSFFIQQYKERLLPKEIFYKV